ncbi:MAG: VacJ family lipoprotein [Desulfopila sp.]
MNVIRYMVLGGVFLLLSPTPAVFAEESFGVGGDDYILDHSTPDLLDNDSDASAKVDEEYVAVSDPLEPLNRVFFTFNDKLYFWVLKPVERGYVAVIPWDFRFVIGNFFDNITSPVDFVNTLLQGRFRDAGIVLGRFVINSTIGVFGFGDAAKESFGIEAPGGDFGQTLGVYGIGEGIYLNWPFFGPSNIRDSVGLVVDWQLLPYRYIGMDREEIWVARGEEFVNKMSITPNTYEELVKASLDPYVAVRQAYIDYRRNKVASIKDK